jgi:hypothetical protein
MLVQITSYRRLALRRLHVKGSNDYSSVSSLGLPR